MSKPGDPTSTKCRRKKRKGGLPAGVACLLAAFLASCGGRKTNRVEVTTSNFAGPPFLTSIQIQSFGVGVGDSEAQAKDAIQRAGLTWDNPLPNNPLYSAQIWDSRRQLLMEVHTSPPPGGPPGKWNYFFHRFWKPARYDYSVDMIAWHPDMKRYLRGNNMQLLSQAMMLPDSTLRRHLLGGEGGRTSQTEVAGSVELVTYTYPGQGFKISEALKDGVWVPGTISFALIPPKK